MKKFSDFARNDANLEGPKTPLADLFGKAIIVKAFRTLPSKLHPERECAQLQYEMDGETKITFTTSSVLISQLRQYHEELPFEATIRREGKYFTFS